MILFPGVAAYRRGGRSELYATVRQDGVIYFAFIFLVSVINVIVALTLPVGGYSPKPADYEDEN
ncbi:hypothetical protein E1B28_010768 [Marasmius oreades]|uniref:Uncharacterized protein n=1 Tax=Marasmius oreades TaxID=181124 RepID=A0A9P7UPA7_9AGAR|nr:uncharacterized protein E1B28_010768 [Marasmius oreades]KAG7089058.1 hypothetical protein E1B28_010768 [Marasmius oreades]